MTSVRKSPSGASEEVGGLTVPAGQLGGTDSAPTVIGLTTADPATLDIGEVPNGYALWRTGTNVEGTPALYFATASYGGGAPVTVPANGNASVDCGQAPVPAQLSSPAVAQFVWDTGNSEGLVCRSGRVDTTGPNGNLIAIVDNPTGADVDIDPGKAFQFIFARRGN